MITQLAFKDRYNPNLASLLIRLGLSATFAYAAISALLQPSAWVSFIPEFSNAFIDPLLALDILSVLQLVLVAWLLMGRYVSLAAITSIALIAGLMVFNLDTFLITFRDIALITSSAALLFLDTEQ